MNYKIIDTDAVYKFKEEKCFKSGIDLIYKSGQKVYSCEIYAKTNNSPIDYIKAINNFVTLSYSNKYLFEFKSSTALDFLFKSCLVRYCVDPQFDKIVLNFLRILNSKEKSNFNSVFDILSYCHNRQIRGPYVNMNYTIYPIHLYVKKYDLYTDPSFKSKIDTDKYLKYISTTTNYPSFALYLNNLNIYGL